MVHGLSNDLNKFIEYLSEISNLNERLTLNSYKKILLEMIEYMFEGDKDKATFENIAKIRSSEYSIKWLKKLECKGLLSATINKRIAVLSRLYTYMIGELYCSSNVAKTIPRSKKNTKVKRVVNKNEAQILLDFARNNKHISNLTYRNYIAIAILLSNGLRVSELEYLRVKDIDLETGKVNICRWNKEGGVKFSKDRICYLNQSILDDIKEYINHYRGNTNEPYLLVSKTGKRFLSRDILRNLNKISEECGLKKINPHSLRACHSSIMINNNNDNADIVRRELGHSSFSTTLNHYFNTDDDELKKLSNENPLFN